MPYACLGPPGRRLASVQLTPVAAQQWRSTRLGRWWSGRANFCITFKPCCGIPIHSNGCGLVGAHSGWPSAKKSSRNIGADASLVVSTSQIGGALAINRIYRTFREHNHLIDVFALELQIATLRCLQLAAHDEAKIGARSALAARIAEGTHLILFAAHAVLKSARTRPGTVQLATEAVRHMRRILEKRADLVMRPPAARDGRQPTTVRGG